MQTVKCPVHEIVFRLPTSNDEFSLGELHLEVELCQLHLTEFPECKLEEIRNE